MSQRHAQVLRPGEHTSHDTYYMYRMHDVHYKYSHERKRAEQLLDDQHLHATWKLKFHDWLTVEKACTLEKTVGRTRYIESWWYLDHLQYRG